MSTTTETPWARYGITKAKWNSLTLQERRKRRYDRWYANNRKKRNKKRRAKYADDDEHRERILQACRDRRPATRAEKADEKFEARLAAARERREWLQAVAAESEETAGGGRKGFPRRGLVAGKKLWLHTSRMLAESCGRGQSTIRAWMAQGVLPGCTIIFKNRYYFSDTFINAVQEACRLVYYENGNGARDVLARLVIQELRKARCSYVPPGGNEKDRVYLSRSA